MIKNVMKYFPLFFLILIGCETSQPDIYALVISDLEKELGNYVICDSTLNDLPVTYTGFYYELDEKDQNLAVKVDSLFKDLNSINKSLELSGFSTKTINDPYQFLSKETNVIFFSQILNHENSYYVMAKIITPKNEEIDKYYIVKKVERDLRIVNSSETISAFN